MSDTELKIQLEAALATVRALLASLEVVAASVNAVGDRDELLSTTQTLERYGIGREAVRAAAERDELAVQRGARGKLLVLDSEMRRFIASRRYRPTPRRPLPPADLDAWEADADRALQLVGRRK